MSRMIELSGGDILLCAGSVDGSPTLIRVTQDHVVVWARWYELGSKNQVLCKDVMELPGGDIVAVGYRASTTAFNRRGFVWRLNGAGKIVWARTTDPTEAALSAVTLNAAGNLTVGGWYGKSSARNALVVELTTLGKEVQTVTIGAGVNFGVEQVGRGPGKDILAVLKGSSRYLAQLTSAGTLRTGWTIPDWKDAAIHDAKVYYVEKTALKVLDPLTGKQSGFSSQFLLDRVHPTPNGVVGVSRRTSALGFVDDVTHVAPKWNQRYTSGVLPQTGDCIQTSSGAFQCATVKYLLRVNKPSLPPNCLRVAGQPFSLSTQSPTSGKTLLRSVQARSPIFASESVSGSPVSLTTKDHCPP